MFHISNVGEKSFHRIETEEGALNLLQTYRNVITNQNLIYSVMSCRIRDVGGSSLPSLAIKLPRRGL